MFYRNWVLGGFGDPGAPGGISFLGGSDASCAVARMGPGRRQTVNLPGKRPYWTRGITLPKTLEQTDVAGCNTGYTIGDHGSLCVKSVADATLLGGFANDGRCTGRLLGRLLMYKDTDGTDYSTEPHGRRRYVG